MKTKRSSPDSTMKICSTCKKSLEAKRFRLYYYESQKYGEAVGPKEKRRIDICKDCSRYRSAKKEEEGINALTKKILKIHEWNEKNIESGIVPMDLEKEVDYTKII